ncbi:alpha amylase, catalytic domain-containing protein [Phthorimaea operculella]|nr:alpha amylase, catalytic domain-containing protein [Phthorimaea operculella]
MSGKNNLDIDGAQPRAEENVDSYKPIPEADQEFRTSKSSLGKSKEKVTDPAEEKLLKKEDEIKITPMSTEAKYDHRNGDTKIELDAAAKRQFTGLTKEELQKYADDPFWVRLRWFMFVLFWALWLCMLAGAIAIIVRAPKCAAPEPKTWYEKGPLVDYSSDSPVDYTALEQELQKLHEAKVQGVFINPCENTYDVLDDSTCVDKFKEFLKKAQEKSVKLIVDLTANFVSTGHKWFVASANGSAEFDKYFVWAAGKDVNPDTNQPNPPNNWKSLAYVSPAWNWSETRQQHYLHQFRSDQADLNFHEAAVVKRFDDVLNKWVAAGANGVRLLKARHLLVNLDLPDEAMSSKPSGASHAEYGFYEHKHTSDQPQLENLFAHWAHLVRGANNENVFTIREDGVLKPDWYKQHNSSSLHPPSAAPVTLTDVNTAVAQLNSSTQHWPILQLSADDAATNEELPALAALLRAAPALTPQQLPAETNDTTHFGQLSSLRNEPSIQFGQQLIAAVPDNNSTDKLIAVARWKAGQPGYVAVLNPGPLPATANLTELSVVPDTLAVHHVSPAVKHLTNYTVNREVPADSVAVPPHSALVLSDTTNLVEARVMREYL